MNRNLQRMDKTQQQMASGKKILVPSDDPIIAARALKLRTNVSEVEQFHRNVEDGINWLEITEGAMKSMGEILGRVRDLTNQAANGPLTEDDRLKIKAEVEQHKQSLISLMNTSYAGRYVFSGYQTDKKLIEDDINNPNYGKYAIEVKVTERMNYEISVNNTIEINTLGQEVLQFGNTVTDTTIGGTPEMLQKLQDIIDHLGGTNLGGLGQAQALSSDLGEIDKALNKLLAVRADLGARYNRLEMTANRLEDDKYNFTKLMSNNEDADLAEVLMNLKTQENVYKASMAAGARIIQPTLIDFLR